MGARMPAAYGQVMAYLGRAGVEAGAPAVARFVPADDVFDVEAGFYVGRPVAGDDGVVGAELPACEAAVVEHIGPYDAMEAAYEAITEWAKANCRELAEATWEEYWSDPATTPPDQWRTVLIWPLKAA